MVGFLPAVKWEMEPQAWEPTAGLQSCPCCGTLGKHLSLSVQLPRGNSSLPAKTQGPGGIRAWSLLYLQGPAVPSTYYLLNTYVHSANEPQFPYP